MIQYIEKQPDNLMVRTFELDNDIGPVQPALPIDEGNSCEPNRNPFRGWPARDYEAGYFVDGAVVVVDTRTIAEARADKAVEMSAACAAAIFAGFPSSALGAEFLYPAKMTDQTNLAGSIIDSLLPGPPGWTTPFWCADAAGAWEFRLHTATQIQQVGRDGKAAILAAMNRNEALQGRIATATFAQLNTIGWAP